MLKNTQEIYGDKLAASDGDIGHVQDFYFDDTSWAVRYVVADTGSWLTGRLVLLAPHALGRLEQAEKLLAVNLTRAQIERSPSIETHRPVSRQHEEEYYRYYGQMPYWEAGGMTGVAGSPAIAPPATPELRPHHGHNQRDDLHLRSTKAIAGYQIVAMDGAVGSVSGFMFDEKSWTIRDVVVETGHWFAGKAVLVSTDRITRISYEESTVFVNLTKADIQRTAENEVAKTHVRKQ